MLPNEDCEYCDNTESNLTSLYSDTSLTGTVSNNNEIPDEIAVTKKERAHHKIKSAVNSHPPQANMLPSKPIEPSVHINPIIHCQCHLNRMDPRNIPMSSEKEGRDPKSNWYKFNWKWPKFEQFIDNRNSYESYVSYDTSEGIPKETKKRKSDGDQETSKYDWNSWNIKPSLDRPIERIDIYYFDHGNSAYYKTTDSPPILATEKCADKTDHVATRFWAEIFGTIHIAMSFITAFILQLLRFLLSSIIRPLTVGIIQMIADYFLKPCLAIIFNAFIQPVIILFYNIATSIRDLCEPLAQAIGFFLREISHLIQACRLIEINSKDRIPPSL